MVYLRNMTSQIITDLQEKARTFSEEKQSPRKWKEIRRENIESLWEKYKDMITAIQDKNKVAWEENITLRKKKKTQTIPTGELSRPY